MCTKKLFTTLLCLISFNVWSDAISVSTFLTKKNNDELNYTIKKPNRIIDEVKFGISKKEKDSFTRDFNHDETEYSMRIYPSGFGTYNLRDKMYKNQKSRFEAFKKYEMAANSSLVYTAYLRLIYGLKLREIHNDLALLYKDKLKVLNSLLKKGEIEIEDLVKNQEAFNENQLEYLRIEGELKEHLSFLKEVSGVKRLSLDAFKGKTKLISLKQIERLIKKEPSKLKLESLKIADLKLKKANIEFELEKSSENKILEFVEVSSDHTNNSDEGWGSSIGVQVRLNVPLFEGNSKTLNEKALARFEDRYKARVEKREALLNYNLLTRNLESTLQSIELIENSSHLKEAKRYLRIFRKRRSSSPLKLLAFNEIIMSSELKKIEYELTAYESYVEILKERGVLSQNSRMNLLNYYVARGVLK